MTPEEKRLYLKKEYLRQLRDEAEQAGIGPGESILNPPTSLFEEPGRYLKETAEGLGAGALDFASFGKLQYPEAQKKAPIAHTVGGGLTAALPGMAARAAIPGAAAALNTIPGLIGEGALLAGSQEFVRSGGDAGATAKGLAMGSVIPAAAGGIKATIGAAKPVVENLRNIFGLKSIGGTAPQLGKELTHGNPSRMVERLLDEKIITPLSSQDDIYQKLVAAESSAGKNIGSFLDEAQKAKSMTNIPVKQPYTSPTEKSLYGSGIPAGKEPINIAPAGKRDLDYILSEMDRAVAKDRTLAPSMPSAKNYVETMAKADDLTNPFSFKKMNEIKRGLGEKGYSLRRQDDTAGHRAFQKGERSIRNIIDADVSSLEELGALDPGALKSYRDMNSRFSDITKARQMAAGEVGRDARRMSQGLVDTGMGVGGAVVGSMAGGAMGSIPGYLMGTALSKGARNYGNQMATVGLDKLNRLLSSNMISPKYSQILNSARSRGLNDLAVANYVLYDTDQKYREEFNNAEKLMDKEVEQQP